MKNSKFLNHSMEKFVFKNFIQKQKTKTIQKLRKFQANHVTGNFRN